MSCFYYYTDKILHIKEFVVNMIGTQCFFLFFYFV